MTYDQFWHGDVSAHKAYREAAKIALSRSNQMAWLQGMYVYEAIADLAPYIKAFSKSRPKPYRDKPLDIFEDERKAREEAEAKARYERMREKVASFAQEYNKRLKNSEQSEVDGDA